MALLGDPRLTIDKAAAACHCGISMKRRGCSGLQMAAEGSEIAAIVTHTSFKIVSFKFRSKCLADAAHGGRSQIITEMTELPGIDALCCCCGSVEAEVLHATVPARRGSHTRAGHLATEPPKPRQANGTQCRFKPNAGIADANVLRSRSSIAIVLERKCRCTEPSTETVKCAVREKKNG